MCRYVARAPLAPGRLRIFPLATASFARGLTCCGSTRARRAAHPKRWLEGGAARIEGSDRFEVLDVKGASHYIRRNYGGAPETLGGHQASGTFKQFLRQTPKRYRKEMSEVARFWDDPIFRRSVKKLVSLESEQLAALTDLTSKGFAVPSSNIEALGLKDSEATLVLAALRTIYRSGQDSGYSGEQSLSEIEWLLETPTDQPSVEITDNNRKGLVELFAPRPGLEHDRQRQLVQAGALPVLDDSWFFVDLRALEDQEGTVRFVPVVLARLFFDEPIAGGVIAFQLTAEGLRELKERVERAGDLLKAVEKQSSEWLY